VEGYPHGDRRPQLMTTKANGIVVLTVSSSDSVPSGEPVELWFADAVRLPELTIILVRMVGERTERWFYKFDYCSLLFGDLSSERCEHDSGDTAT
jgi:hypothetical protein